MKVINRRAFVKGIGMSAAAVAVLPIAVAAKESTLKPFRPRFAYVGSRTTKERKARGKGIEVYRIGQNESEWEHIQLLDGLTNPSFLITDAERRFLYTVHGDESEITSFAIDADIGKLRKIATASTQGKNPVHLVIHPSSQTMLVANYATGSIVTIPISTDGTLSQAGDPIFLPGESGPHRTEQTMSHPHQIVADRSGRFFLVPDKGLDRIFTIAVDERGKLEIVTSIATRQGAGPRHAVFNPQGDIVHVVNELDSSITTYGFDSTSGALTPIEIVPSVPTSFLGDNRAAAIGASTDGSQLFATNRGQNTVVQFNIDAASGKISDPRWHQTLGKGPRFASLSPTGKTLFVANELTDTVVAYDLRAEGMMTNPTETAATGSPVSIAFA